MTTFPSKNHGKKPLKNLAGLCGNLICVNAGDRLQFLENRVFAFFEFRRGPWRRLVQVTEATIKPLEEGRRGLIGYMKLTFVAPRVLQSDSEQVSVVHPETKVLPVVVLLSYEIFRKHFDAIRGSTEKRWLKKAAARVQGQTCMLKRSEEHSLVVLGCPHLGWAPLGDLRK